MERVDHGQQVFRTHCRNSFLKQYEKAATFLRLELVSNNVRDFRLKKSLIHWEAMRQRFKEITDRFAAVQAQNLARYFNTTPQFWINLQAHYELDTARLAAEKAVARTIRPAHLLAKVA